MSASLTMGCPGKRLDGGSPTIAKGAPDPKLDHAVAQTLTLHDIKRSFFVLCEMSFAGTGGCLQAPKGLRMAHQVL